MTQEIRLSLISPRAETLQPYIDRFEQEESIRVNLTVLTWGEAWNKLVKASLYQHDLDVSEIGSTWVGDLAKMGSLRPFAPYEITTLGGASAFLPSFWNSGRTPGSDQQIAIPWLTGVRLLYYRRSLLQKAGLDPATAFANIETFTETLYKLREAGVPWLVTTQTNHDTLLNIATWIWARGGEFLAPNGKKTLFAEPEALAGMTAYFELGRLLPPAFVNLDPTEANYHFLDNPNIATFISGGWLNQWARERLTPEQASDIGIALPPGASFTGGSYLVLWKNAQRNDAVIKLVNYLTQAYTSVNYGALTLGLIPARLETLDDPAFADPFWQTSIAGMRSGRAFPSSELWGLIQDRLTQEFGNIWKEILADPSANVSEVVAECIKALARRLDITLGN